VRKLFFEILAAVLVLASLALLYAAVRFLATHDYAAGLVAGLVGVAVLQVAAEMARLALADRQ